MTYKMWINTSKKMLLGTAYNGVDNIIVYPSIGSYGWYLFVNTNKCKSFLTKQLPCWYNTTFVALPSNIFSTACKLYIVYVSNLVLSVTTTFNPHIRNVIRYVVY